MSGNELLTCIKSALVGFEAGLTTTGELKSIIGESFDLYYIHNPSDKPYRLNINGEEPITEEEEPSDPAYWSKVESSYLSPDECGPEQEVYLEQDYL
jgi:hypothetical protein